MNLTLSDNLLGRQRSRQWSPLITQQYRLRHVHQILGLNFAPLPSMSSYYYTLHLTTLSAPFYTSDRIDNVNPKWPELDLRNLPNLSATALVLRVWQHCDKTDSMVTTWGINLSGLVYIGNKIADVQSTYFAPKTVIFNIRGAFFTTKNVISEEAGKPPPFSENLNLVEVNSVKKIYKKAAVTVYKNDVRHSYNIDKLRRLQSLQVNIRNTSQDVQIVREKIEVRFSSGSSGKNSPPDQGGRSSLSNVRYAPQLLTMKSVNKMMEQRPTKMQRREMEKIRNAIEIEQFRCKLLSQERDKKCAQIRRFKSELTQLLDRNEQKNSDLIDQYNKLQQDTEKLKEIRKEMAPNSNILTSLLSQLHQRRRQLLRQLLFVYPIQQISEKKFTIHGIYVPNSDILSDVSDGGVSVALGYISHILVMASTFLQVPLRYQMTHVGSRSFITDHVSPILPEREREFPLFTKGKERIQFTYAVYLLNKNIAQLRWLSFMHTAELKATLPNLLSFLEGKDIKDVVPMVTTAFKMNCEDISARLPSFSKKYNKLYRSCECGPGLSEILAIPEAFMNKQMTSDSFKNYVATKKFAELNASIVIKEGTVDKVCDHDESIEQGTDLLDPALDLSELESSVLPTELEKWMNNEASSECCSNDGGSQTCQNFDQSESLQSLESPLTVRTDALRNIKSFNLVKTKPNV